MTPEQQAFIDKARRSLQAARLLASQDHPDFAASRAYYAMFYVAQAFLLQRGLSFSKHSAVHAAFGEHFAKLGTVPTKLHRWLLDAAESRTAGDYEIGLEVTREDAEVVMEHAEEFLVVAEHLLASTPPAGA